MFIKTDIILRGEGISIRSISIQDCTETYVEWLNDSEVNQYLETRWSKQDINSVRNFVIDQLDNDHSFLFAIIYGNTDRHIGNIKIGPVNKHYNYANISYFIGDKSLWGNGIATRAIQLVCAFGFNELHLHRIEAGAYSAAVCSWKALEKNGFKREAVLREQVISGDKYMDLYRYGILKTEYYNNIKMEEK